MRSEEEIIEMKQAIQSCIDDLPEFNAFGGSNHLEVLEMRGHIKDLELLENGIVSSSGSEVSHWYRDTGFSSLNDYLA